MKLKEISAQCGVIVNYQKTKYLRCTRKNYRPEELQTDSVYLEQVQSYKYLGSTVNSDKSIEEDIQYRKHLEIKPIMQNNFSLKVDWSARNQN